MVLLGSDEAWKRSLNPNLWQGTLENNPAFIPTAGRSQHRAWLQFGGGDPQRDEARDYVVTGVRFRRRLGAEKFIDIKCRRRGCARTRRSSWLHSGALKYHGGGRRSSK